MILRNGAIYILGRAVPGVLGFATAMLLTWFLAPDALGLYGMGMAVVVLGNNILFEWLAISVMRWHETHQGEPAFLPTVLVLFAGMGLLPLLLLALATVSGLAGRHAAFAWIVLFGIVAYGWFEFAARLQVCRFQPVRYLAMSLVRSGLMLAGATLVAYLTRSGTATLLVSFVAMAAAGCLFLADLGRGALSPWRRFDPALAREFVAYGVPAGLSMILSGLTTSVTPIMLGALSGTAAVGAYTVAFTLVQNTLLVIAAGISSAIFPLAVRAAESGDAPAAQTLLSRNCTLLLALLLPAGVGLSLLAPEIAEVFVGPEYREVLVRTVPWLAACAVLMAMRATHLDYAFHLGKRTGLLLRVVAVAATVNVALGAALIPRWGPVGAAAAMACAFAVALVHAAILAKRAYPMPMPIREACGVVVATGLMAAAVETTPAAPGILALLAQVTVGIVAYAAVLVVLDALTPCRVLGGGGVAHLPPWLRPKAPPPASSG